MNQYFIEYNSTQQNYHTLQSPEAPEWQVGNSHHPEARVT